ncbi:MAG: thiol oxidoreductase [Gammaproteobacteria bacterium]|nr:thiol oxidoreductase [Gammaproteobacteria bacterium]
MARNKRPASIASNLQRVDIRGWRLSVHRVPAAVGLIAASLLAPPGLTDPEPAQVALGRSIFNTQWSPASAPSADPPSVDAPAPTALGSVRREGLGPLFNATSCNTCHNEGAGGRGPTGDGPIPIALEIQLGSSSEDVDGQASGDPVYGRVFSTSAVESVEAEGMATVHYSEIYGYYYPDGTHWRMRAPHYRLVGLSRGPLAATTVIKPRLAPPLFGVGLLEAVPGLRGRFGWQANMLSIRDQTTKALAAEMGLTSPDRPSDDCTLTESDCQRQHHNESPEVSEELIEALVAFQRTLAVPESPPDTKDNSLGFGLFREIGCAVCHKLQIPVELSQADGTKVRTAIAPYTDLQTHDLGREMDDETVAGAKVRSRWRTAPLWGLGYRMKTEGHPTLLHDGRARSAEEAILWHSGEAAPTRQNFVTLGPRSRQALLHWLETR